MAKYFFCRDLESDKFCSKMGPERVEPHLFRCKESPWSFLNDLLQCVHVTMVNSRLKFTQYNKNDDSTRIAGSCDSCDFNKL